MRRAIAGIAALFVVLAVSVFVPMVPSSASARGSGTSSGSHPCAVNLPGCIFAGESVQGYGSISYYLMGKGAFYYQGNYQLTANSSIIISVSA